MHKLSCDGVCLMIEALPARTAHLPSCLCHSRHRDNLIQTVSDHIVTTFDLALGKSLSTASEVPNSSQELFRVLYKDTHTESSWFVITGVGVWGGGGEGGSSRRILIVCTFRS